VPIRTRRINDAPLPDDGYRVLVTRYRPRGVKREDETWDAWWPNLGPSVALHAAAYGKSGAPPIAWVEYRSRYLAARVAAGDVVTLLCSSACIDEARCHRTLLRDLIEASLAKPEETKPHAVVRRRR
jgi:uncharacterized protein YeaO (DUF488 family)